MGAETLEALNRERLGKGGARQTRRQKLVPVVVYGHNQETRHLAVPAHDLEMILTRNARLVDLKAEGQVLPCLVRDIQRHPVNEQVVHVDFMVVQPDQKVTTELPVRLNGNPIGVKQGGQVRRLLGRVKVNCAVADLPSFFDIDITNLEAGRNLLVKDLGSEKIRLLNPDHVAVVQITKARPK
ncbi:MAG: 50S ribosomal protein L25 [bacterium]|jgi:large subunit ribosomal protein L25|nr:50S ribosomal protein L25 [bacterium]